MQGTMPKSSKNFNAFFEWTKEYAKEHGKKIIVRNVKSLRDGGKHAGECNGNSIVVAKKTPLFEETYAHEFSHLTQAVEEIDLWEKGSAFFDSLGTSKISFDKWDELMDCILLERDCEQRTLSFSKKWNLFDNDLYAQRANTYLFYYQYVFMKRRWISSTTIYVPEIVEKMPKKLASEAKLNIVDINLMKLYDSALDPKRKGSRISL